jgi:Trypsin-co-occurring domain 1
MGALIHRIFADVSHTCHWPGRDVGGSVSITVLSVDIRSVIPAGIDEALPACSGPATLSRSGGSMAVVLLKVPLDEASAEFIEVEIDRREFEDAVELAADDRGRDVARAPFNLAASMDRVLPALRIILARLRSDELAPDEIGMHLGLKVGGETGLVFAKGTAEATFTVTATWRKPAAV